MTTPVRFSIVTPSMNQGEFIRDTVESVLRQGYPSVEYIVCDGGSTDGTIGVLKDYSHIQWTSERDRGQSDAINKGFRLATGEILAWINSDDSYEEGAFAAVDRVFRQHPEIDVIYGDCVITDEHGRVVRRRREIDFDPFVLLHGFNYIPQPSTFFRRGIVHRAGDLDITLKYSMDYEYFLRLWRMDAVFFHLRQCLSRYRLHPKSITYRQPGAISEEYRKIRQIHDTGGLGSGQRTAAVLNIVARAKRQLLKVTQGIPPDPWPLDWEIRVRKLFKRM